MKKHESMLNSVLKLSEMMSNAVVTHCGVRSCR